MADFQNLRRNYSSKMQCVCFKTCKALIEHSENKTITYFESEVRPRVLQSGLQLTYTLKNFSQKRLKRPIICGQYFESLDILQHSSLLNAGIEHFRFDLFFMRPRFNNHFIFGMFYYKTYSIFSSKFDPFVLFIVVPCIPPLYF